MTTLAAEQQTLLTKHTWPVKSCVDYSRLYVNNCWHLLSGLDPTQRSNPISFRESLNDPTQSQSDSRILEPQQSGVLISGVKMSAIFTVLKTLSKAFLLFNF